MSVSAIILTVIALALLPAAIMIVGGVFFVILATLQDLHQKVCDHEVWEIDYKTEGWFPYFSTRAIRRCRSCKLERDERDFK